MKKQMLLVFLMAGCTVSGIFAGPSEDDVNKNATAFVINYSYREHQKAIEKGIPSTQRINGAGIWRLLNGYEEMNTEEVLVVSRYESGVTNTLSIFRDPIRLDVDELRRCYNKIGLDSECKRGWDRSCEEAKSYRDVDYNHLRLVRDLMNDKCFLCTQLDNGESAIVINDKDSDLRSSVNPLILCHQLKESLRHDRKLKQKNEMDKKFDFYDGAQH